MNISNFKPFDIDRIIKLFDKAKDEYSNGLKLMSFVYFALAFLLVMVFIILILIILIYLFYSIKNLSCTRRIEVPKEIIELQLEYEAVKVKYNNDPKSFRHRVDSIWTKASSIPINDKAGNRAILTIYTLSSDYYWEKGQSRIHGVFGNEFEKFNSYINSEYFRTGYSKFSEIICIGNSSFEETKDSIEECRSYCRSIYLSNILKGSLPFNRISILPIGKSDSSLLNSDFQRRVILLGIKKVDTLINIKDAIYLHLLTDKNVPFRFWDYSLCKSYETFYNPSRMIHCKENCK